MQDEYGRTLSDDGQWVWDGSAWRPTAGGAAPGGAAGPGTSGYEPTMVAPRDYEQTGGQGQQPYYTGPAGPIAPGGPQGPYGPYAGGPPPPTPWYQNRTTVAIVVIAVLLVLSAVLVTILLVTSKSGNDSPGPSPTSGVPSSAVTTESSSPPPTSEAPTTPPPTSEAPTTPPPTTPPPPVTTITPGLYDCTSGGSQIGTVNFTGNRYTTSTGARGTYVYDETTGDIAFTGPDLGDYSGTYDPTGPSMDLTSSGGSDLHCAQ